MKNKKNVRAFTLIEIMMGILIVSIVATAGLYSLSSVNVGKVKLIEKTFLEKQVFAFQEKFFEAIKEGGTIDYEEYFNRNIFDNTSFSGGHYSELSGFGNFGNSGIPGSPSYGDQKYLCRSGNTFPITMGTGGCFAANINTSGLNQSGKIQRYGQYELQFIDYNSDADNNSGTPGDENGDGNIVGDDDDEYLGIGPQAFASGVYSRELYLVNGLGDERTFFRWSVIQDPDASASDLCDLTTNQESPSGIGCLGKIEFLKLIGKDYGDDHDPLIVDTTQYDGKVDTWLIHPDFLSNATPVIADSNTLYYWQPLFADSVNIKDLKFYLYPNKDLDYSWKDSDPNIGNAPYVRIYAEITPSWKVKRKIKGEVPSITLSTTISLTNIFSNSF